MAKSKHLLKIKNGIIPRGSNINPQLLKDDVVVRIYSKITKNADNLLANKVIKIREKARKRGFQRINSIRIEKLKVWLKKIGGPEEKKYNKKKGKYPCIVMCESLAKELGYKPIPTIEV